MSFEVHGIINVDWGFFWSFLGWGLVWVLGFFLVLNIPVICSSGRKGGGPNSARCLLNNMQSLC